MNSGASEGCLYEKSNYVRRLCSSLSPPNPLYICLFLNDLSSLVCLARFLSFPSKIRLPHWKGRIDALEKATNNGRYIEQTKKLGKKREKKKYLIVGSKLNNSNQIPSPRHESIVYKKRGINLIWNAFLSTAEYSATCVRYRVRCICVPVWCNLRNSLWTSHGDRNGIIFFFPPSSHPFCCDYFFSSYFDLVTKRIERGKLKEEGLFLEWRD